LSAVNLDQWLGGLNGSLAAEFNPVQTNVSGGQIQRLVIARALLRASDILLLDEATSAVDAATEQDISERLIKKVRDQRGVLLAVTHRLRWLELFDEVWFVENGRVEFKGKHGALLNHDRYRAFCAKGEES
jgi:ATP-binding cassette subfamily B protein/ATP-binding cassette subfamily C protein